MPKPFRPLKTISTTLTIFIILLAFPATAIMASWKSIPGSTLYPIKRGLEKVALALLPDSFYETQFRLKLIDRRTAEATISIIKSPNEMQALNELLAEAKAAQFATTSLEETRERSEAIQQLITKLTATNQTLEDIKTTTNSKSSSTNNSPSYNNQPQTTNQSPSITTLTNNSQSSTNQPDADLPPSPSEPDPPSPSEPDPPSPSEPDPPSPSEPDPPSPQPDNDPTEQITNTQEEIEDIIEDLEETLENPSALPVESTPAAEPDPEPTDTSPGKSGQSQGKHKGQNEDDDNDD